MSAFARARQTAQKRAAPPDYSSDSEAGVSDDETNGDQDVGEEEGVEHYDSMSEDDEESLVKAESDAAINQFLATSTWTPTADNASGPFVDGWQILKLGPRESATFLGQYEFRVTRGIINVAGALCRDWPDATQRVFAPSTHALPVMQCLSDEEATVKVRRAGQSIRKLSQLSPLFRKIWSHSGWKDAAALNEISQRGFSYVTDATHDPLKRPLRPLMVDDSWQKPINSICLEKCSRENPVTFVLGPQGSGKSTFGRLLLNRMLTLMRNEKERLFESVCYLDLDPGQSEFTPCAQVSLVQVTKPVIGPPFTHCVAGPSSSSRVLRAHAVSAASIKDDIDRVMVCVRDLVQRYLALSATAKIGPLIINTPGAVTGLSLDALLSIMQISKPDHVVFLGGEKDEAKANIQKAAEEHKAVLHMPQRTSQRTKSRTAAQLRDMQIMSYFHASNLSNGNIFWQPIPVSADTWNLVTLRFPNAPTGSADANSQSSDRDKDAAFTASILGVASLAEQPPAGHLATVIDGNVLAAVYVDDDETLEAIQSSLEPEVEPSPRIPQLTAKKTSHLLQPDRTNLVGLVIVQRITSAELTVHSPDCDTLVRACSSGRVILVRRNVEAPGWAYTEPIYLTRSWRERDGARWRAETSGSEKAEHATQPHRDVKIPEYELRQDEISTKWVTYGKRKAKLAEAAMQRGQDSGNGRSQPTAREAQACNRR